MSDYRHIWSMEDSAQLQAATKSSCRQLLVVESNYWRVWMAIGEYRRLSDCRRQLIAVGDYFVLPASADVVCDCWWLRPATDTSGCFKATMIGFVGLLEPDGDNEQLRTLTGVECSKDTWTNFRMRSKFAVQWYELFLDIGKLFRFIYYRLLIIYIYVFFALSVDVSVVALLSWRLLCLQDNSVITLTIM